MSPSVAGDWKEQALADFRRWLDDLQEMPQEVAEPQPSSCDLHDLFSELAALRQEVRLQNREQSRAGRELANAAARYDAIDRTARRRDEDLAALETRVARAAEDRCLLPVLELRDALVRGREAAHQLREAEKKAEGRAWRRARRRRLQPVVDGVVDGYELAVRRCDGTLARFGVQSVATVGSRFDARTMHAVAARQVADREDGVVVEEFVSGFVRDGAPLRLAEVAVNRVQGGE